ncbi:MAG: cupin domain-containing protein [Acidimicrobiales bacterium]
MSTARSAVTANDERVRVTTWTFADGEATGHHRHELDYVVVPVTGGRFAILDDDGSTREKIQEAGVAYRGHAGATHDVVNRSGQEAIFVEVEIRP